MCTKQRFFLIVLGGALLASSILLGAEVRFWRDRAGTVYRGQYVRQAFGKTYFKGVDGKSFYIQTDSLIDSDLEYIKSLLPPEITVRVMDKETEVTDYPPEYTPERWDDHEFELKMTINVKKKGRDVYSGTLRGEVYLIGEEVGAECYRLFAKKGFGVKFPDNQSEFDFKFSESYRYYDFNEVEPWGMHYKGYVVIIEDPDGNLMDFKSSVSWIKKENIEKLRTFICPTFFDDKLQGRSTPRPKDDRDPESF
jgi:hypothetical protein